MQRVRVGAAVAGVIALAAVFAIPPNRADPAPVVAAPLTPIAAGAERLPIGPPFAAVTPGSVQRAAHAAPASVTRPQVTVAPAPSGPQGIPVPVLDAYRRAAALLTRSDAGCHLEWNLLAGIGRIESGHAYGGRVDDAGTTRGKILGPRLDGSLPGTAVITDSDGGAMDGDSAFDHATGPMQFLPGTWRGYGADGNDDGVADPNNVYDAALGAGRYLCAGPGDLHELAGVRQALHRYNPSEAYGLAVMGWAEAYRTGTTPVPPRTDPVPVPSPEALAAGSAPDGASEPEPTSQAAAPGADQAAVSASTEASAAGSAPDGTREPERTPQAASPDADQGTASATSSAVLAAPSESSTATAPTPEAGAAEPGLNASAATPTGSPATPSAAAHASPAPPTTAPSTPAADGAASTTIATPYAAAPDAGPNASAAMPTGSPATPSATAPPGSPAAAPSAAAPTPQAAAPETGPSTSAATPTEPPVTDAATPNTVPSSSPTAAPAAAECPATTVVLEPAALRVLPDGSVLLRFAIPAGCTVTGATLRFTPDAADVDRPVEIRRVTGEWDQQSTDAPATAEPALTAAVPGTGSTRAVPVTALVVTGGTGLLLGTSGELTGPVQLTLTVG